MNVVELERPADGVALLRFNRPERLNALNSEMFRQLDELLPQLDSDPDTKVIVLTGAGRAFCAGHDLHELPALMELDLGDRLAQIDWEVETLVRLRLMHTPVIAAVNGPAFGGGMSIAASCDIRIASADATFGVAFINIGISSGDAALSWTLPRIIGLGNASELMLTGRVLDAQEAKEMGFVNRIVPGDQLIEQALATADMIAKHNRLALRFTKRTLIASANRSVRESIDLENSLQILAMDSPQARRHNERFLDTRGDAKP